MADFPSCEGLTWQEWRDYTSPMESKPNSTNGCQDNPFAPEEAVGTESNQNVYRAMTHPTKGKHVPSRARCSSCNKRGLGKIKLGRSWEPDVRYCQYCGDIHIVRSSRDKDNSTQKVSDHRA